MVKQAKEDMVVVGVDGSDSSIEAVRWAQRYADATGASIHLVTAWQWPVMYGAPLLLDGYSPEQDAQVIADTAVKELTLPSDRVHVLVQEGPARESLMKASENADLLVLGSKGHNPLTGLLLGSVSDYCARHASVPVVIVR